MKLYDYYRSSSAYRVRIALALKQIDASIIPINLREGEQCTSAYLSHNVQGLVPTLIDNDHTLTQSLAIIEYLDECYPTPPLLPASPYERAQVRAFAQIIACEIHPLNNLRVLNTLREEWQADPEQIQTWYHHWLKKGFDAIESQLTQYPRNEPFCYTNQVTLADICLVPQIYNAKRFEFSLEPYPMIQSINNHCETLPAFIQAHPKQHETQ
ncbi:MAG: maleylacetoacetate isomerase [Gammaproteobacteria bacterium]|nr:maleylacetoacetate isomerase [Gammaproteobacteria bacterium]